MTHRVVFLGSPDFALPSLRALHDDSRFEVVLVVSQPDRPAGRGRKLVAPPVAAFAQEADLPLFQPLTLRDDDARARLEEVNPELLVVVAYGEILRTSILTLAKCGAINVHPSLLPKYRGASPVAAAILNGDMVTGVSIMKLVRRLDAGPVIAQRQEAIHADDTTGSLSARLSEIAADMLPDVADAWLRGAAEVIEQDDSRATFTREWTKDDARINWWQPAEQIERLVRAALPWPVAWTTLAGRRVQVRSVDVVDDRPVPVERPGSFSRINDLVCVRTGQGLLSLNSVQPEGKQAIDALQWWNGLQPTSEKHFS